MPRWTRVDELPAIASLKLRMFAEAGMAEILAEDVSDRILTVYRACYAQGTAQHFVIETDGRIASCTGAFLKDDVPYCFYRQPLYGFIGDVYTLPEYRRRGYARQLTNEAIRWLERRGIETIRLLATPQARPLYVSLGFRPSDEMVLRLV